jgi:hypothetical protein
MRLTPFLPSVPCFIRTLYAPPCSSSRRAHHPHRACLADPARRASDSVPRNRREHSRSRSDGQATISNLLGILPLLWWPLPGTLFNLDAESASGPSARRIFSRLTARAHTPSSSSVSTDSSSLPPSQLLPRPLLPPFLPPARCSRIEAFLVSRRDFIGEINV